MIDACRVSVSFHERVTHNYTYATIRMLATCDNGGMSKEIIDKFIHWAEADRRRSKHTIERYRATLDQLEDPIGADVEQIEAWWQSRYGMSAATRSNELACLRTFYKWAMRFDYRETDPTRRLDYPKVDNNIPRPIPSSDVDRLLGVLTADEPELRRAIALGVYAGCRVSEAAALDWLDIDMESNRLYIRGKGSKQRVMGLSPILLDKIAPNTGGNVVTAGGKPYNGQVLQRKINRFMERHGIEHTYHDLRKRGATLAMAKVGNPQAVAQAFGWSSLQTVTHYALVGDETLDEIAQAMI